MVAWCLPVVRASMNRSLPARSRLYPRLLPPSPQRPLTLDPCTPSQLRAVREQLVAKYSKKVIESYLKVCACVHVCMCVRA